MLPIGVTETEVESIVESMIGIPNGIAGLDEDGDIVGTVTNRYDTASAINAIILKNGETAFTTDTKEVRRGNGTTPGGVFFGAYPVGYTGGPTELTSTSTDSITLTIPLVASAMYRIWGDFSFSGDTDNQSNFLARLLYPSGLITSFPTISSFHVSIQWINSTNSGVVTPDVRYFTPLSLPQFPNLGLTPVNTTSSSGAARIDGLLATNAANNLSLTMRLRTAKIATPTILAAYRMFIQRLA